MQNKTNQSKQPLFRSLRATWIAPVLLALLACPLAAQADTLIRTSSFEYNTAGLLTKEVIEPDSPNDCLQTSYTFDAYGNKTSTSTSACPGASGNTLSSAATARTHTDNFGADGRFALSSANALGHSESKTYDPRFGSLTSLTGPNGLTTTWTYDGFGRKTQETRADGTKTTWAYKLCTDAGANCPTSIGGATITWVVIEQSLAANLVASAPEKRQYFDALNRVVRVQTQGFDGAGVAAPTLVQDTEYNALGQVARKSNLYALNTDTPYWASYSYDVLGRLTSEQVTDPAAPGGVAITSTTYNALSSTVTNSKGQSKTTVKNAQGQVALVTDALGSTINYSFDALGNLLATNAAGAITRMSYNQRGQKVAMQDPAMGSWVYAYNAYGELISQRDSLGQSSTMAYDVLGRMTQRVEPDLVSQWRYDTQANGSACGKSVGKLCQAQTDNGYLRSHTFDTLGRLSSTSTVLDSATTPASVSQSFDVNTGRVASKTWPSGYQASYTYTPLGYLKTVTGGGTAGYAQTVSYTVLAMNAQGQVTQYRTGNNVTTVKTHEAATHRLLGQSATLDGQGTGNVLNHSYSYDALGNLLSRSDNSPGVGTQESYSYDSLNRLSTATLVGGSVSPPTSVEVTYDARGNIDYKSDVGRYWYDPARPNRMTNVTLETAPGATQALTGTRSLSYAFDDYKAGAQSINGTTVGNGNLEYTVTQDSTNNRHTVRAESYTSFNMPKAITFGNLLQDSSQVCPEGYSRNSEGQCQAPDTVIPAQKTYQCASGGALSGTSDCEQNNTIDATPMYTCATGYALQGSQCVKDVVTAASAVMGCPSGYTWQYVDLGLSGIGYFCVTRDSDDHYVSAPKTVVGYSCPAGKTLSGRDCLEVQSQAATLTGYSCPEGWTASGSQCTQTLRSTSVPATARPVYTCPAGKVLRGASCDWLSTSTGPAVMGCPYGYTWTNLGEFSGYACAKVTGEDGNRKTYATTPQIVVDYTCPAGTVSYWSNCRSYSSTPASVASYSCPSGQTLSGKQCSLLAATFAGYSCPGGSINSSDNTCTISGQVLTATGPASADRTLSFVYGAEHQRVKQNIILSGNGTSSYFAGNVWYLNGEDSLGLSYEKEVRANGTTEHKHYISAGGVVFAEFISRTGTLNGLSVTSTHYFQHDQLGSVAAITNEAGVVIERLAYDPWGKRRYINTTPGQPDTLDALAGQATDRGYTMHEHLDEVGIIHMNGRIYDPLIGRFMSADSHVTNPYDLQSFNRNAYVSNNPLRYTDPTGQDLDGDAGEKEASSYAESNYSSSNGWSSSSSDSRSIAEVVVAEADTGWTYGGFSTWGHIGLSTLGTFPVLGAIPDGVDFIWTGVEIPFGKSSLFDLALAGGGLLGTAAPAVGDGPAALAKISARLAAKEALSDAALVCRGGACKAENFISGSGVTRAADGTLSGVSTQSAAGESLSVLAKPFKNNQVGVTTAGDIRAAGGRITADGHPGNPNHATIDRLTGAQLEHLFSPTVKNPVPPALRGH